MASVGENGNGSSGEAATPQAVRLVPETDEAASAMGKETSATTSAPEGAEAVPAPPVDLYSPARVATFKGELLEFLGELVPQGGRAWDIGVFEGYGRGLVATRDIAVNEEIFVDRPILVGPRVNNYEVIFCASCCRILRRLQLCSGGCRLPICGRCDFANRAASPHAGECRLIQSWQPKDAARYSKHILYALTSIRGFLLSERDRAIVLQMEGHPPRKEMTTEIERLLKDGYFHKLADDAGAVRYLRQVVNVLNTNAFETSRIVADEENNEHEIILRGLYILGALMNHCCRPNVRYMFDSELRMRVYASRPIRAGEQLLNNYSKILWGTQHRIIHLCFSKNFICCCERCKDPTESGTYLGALKCVRESCPDGRLLPTNPLKISSVWRCDRCDLRMDNVKATKIQEIAGRMILNNTVKRESSYIIAYLNDHILRFLLPTNQFTVELKLQAIKKIQADRPVAELREKEKYCVEILDILERLDYGECFVKGVLCYELFATRVTLGQVLNESGLATDEANLALLRTAWQILRPSGNRPKDLQQLAATYGID